MGSGETDSQTRHRHDRLLEATAKATKVLLTVENFDEAINIALKIILDAAGCDRLKVVENNFDGSSAIPEFGSMIYVCTKPGMSEGESRIYSSWVTKEFLERYFLHGEGFCGLIDELDEPLRSKVAGSQSQSMCAVPIRVNGHWWGMLSLNYSDPIQVSPAEFSVIKTIADCIGSAIQRDRLQQERQQAIQQRMADLEAYNRALQGRDRLFESAAKATNVLLTVENLDEAINSTLKIIGEGIGCDRFHILENTLAPSSTLPIRFSYIYEWSRPEFTRSLAQLELAAVQAAQLEVAFIEQYFLNGNGFGGLLEVWPESLQNSSTADQVQSAYAVPIRVNRQWWGVLGFQYCREAIQISPPEVSVLMAIADCIGSAIQRDRLRHAELRTQKEREQAAQERATELEEYNQRLLKRDRLLKAAAQATNVLLTMEDLDRAIHTALQTTGEGIGCDRLNVLENIFESSPTLPSRFALIQEWSTPEFARQPWQLLSAAILADQLVAFLEQYFLHSDGFGGLIEVWPEAIRNSLIAADRVQSAYAVPIRVSGQWWGVLCLDYCRSPIQVSTAEISVLMAIADCIGSAIQRDRDQKLILQAEQNRVLELAQANDAMRRSIDWLARDPDMNAFLGHQLQEIAAQFDAQDAQIFLYNPHDRTLQTLVGFVDDEITFFPPYTSEENVDRWSGWEVLLQSSKPRPFNIDTESHFFPPDYLEFHRRRNNRGFVCTVLWQDDQPLGMIGFACRNRETFLESELELVQSLAQQATLAIQLTRLAEEAQQLALLQERTRIAREIHDTLAQAFGGILMQLQASTYFAETQPDQAQTHLLTAQALAQEGLAEARRSVWTLYLETTEYENLDQAIAKFIEQTRLRQSVPIDLVIEGNPHRLHPDLGLNLLRIAQEAIANALHHAHATTIQVHLSYSAQVLQLTIRDDGCGFDPQSPSHGFGLLGMQQRASRIGATWNLMSRPAQGTTLMITLTHSQNEVISKG